MENSEQPSEIRIFLPTMGYDYADVSGAYGVYSTYEAAFDRLVNITCYYAGLRAATGKPACYAQGDFWCIEEWLVDRNKIVASHNVYAEDLVRRYKELNPL